MDWSATKAEMETRLCRSSVEEVVATWSREGKKVGKTGARG